jgi:tetratricopeptide (TPR) repeat protein
MTGRSTSLSSRLPAAVALLVAMGSAQFGCRPPALETVEPPATEAAVIHAAGLLRLGAPAEALATVESVLEVQPSHIWAHRVAQDALIALDRRGEAVESYSSRTEEHPDQAIFAYLAGRILLPDVDAARPHFEAAVALDPELAWGHVGLAQLEVLHGDMFRAIVIHEEQIALLSDDADLQMSLGYLSLDLHLLRDAQAAFRRAEAERPWDPRILGGLGQTLGQLGDDSGAIEALEAAIEIDPSRTDLMGALALVRYNSGDLEAAWAACMLQQEVDASADPHLRWTLEAELDRTMPQFAVLGPRHLLRTAREASP